jgi:hypothetical protein
MERENKPDIRGPWWMFPSKIALTNSVGCEGTWSWHRIHLSGNFLTSRDEPTIADFPNT